MGTPSGTILKDLTGRRFGMLVVDAFSHWGNHRHAYWRCRCDCGVQKAVAASSLLQGQASCGCVRKGGRKPRHGQARDGRVSTEYRAWGSMLARVSPKTRPRVRRRYFDRGIVVCERWKVFENFLADMGQRPRGRWLDRINNGNYEPGNCRWATPEEQAHNRADPSDWVFGDRHERAAHLRAQTSNQQP